MIRAPELKKQVAILEAKVKAATGATLQHAAALEIIAELNGFKNWRHAANEVTPFTETKAVSELTPLKTFDLAMIFGNRDIHSFQMENADPKTLSTYQVLKFGTDAERTAYQQGLAYGAGWDACHIVREELTEALINTVSEVEAEDMSNALKEMGFSLGISGQEFSRNINDDFASENGDEFAAYQYVIVKHDDLAGLCVDMDCALIDSGDFLTRTPLFQGKTPLEALQKALAVANAQRDEALEALEKMRTP
jgi:hypothetical protein